MVHESLIEPLQTLELRHRRTRAAWIDVVVLAAVFTALSAITGHAHDGNWTSVSSNGTRIRQDDFSISLPTGLFLLWVALAILYYSVGELLTGQTLGKRAMGLKVVMLDGRAAGGRAVALRTFGRVIDVLPIFYLVGWLSMRGSHRPLQRVGDRIAGTTVVPASKP